MKATIKIDGNLTQQIVHDERFGLLRYQYQAEIELTLEIGMLRSFRRTLRYECLTVDNSPISIINEIIEKKRFIPSFDIFDCPYARTDITSISIEWDRSNTFLSYLFDYMKGDKLEEFARLAI